MFTGKGSLGDRWVWAVVYTLLALAGLAVLHPVTTPKNISDNVDSNGVTNLVGLIVFVFYGVAAIVAYIPKDKLYWLENTMSWFGNIGLATYLFSVAVSLGSGEPTRASQFFLMTALLLVMVIRSIIVQKFLRTQNRTREIVRIALRNADS